MDGQLTRARQKRNVVIVWLIILASVGALITFGVLWQGRDRLSDAEQAQFKKAMGQSMERARAWEKARKAGVIRAFRHIGSSDSGRTCPVQLPMPSREDLPIMAQMIPEKGLDQHYGVHADNAFRYLGHGEPGVDRYGYLNQKYQRLLKGKNIWPKAQEWPKLLRDVEKYGSPAFWDKELLFVAVEKVEAVGQFDRQKFKPGMAAGWALLWDFSKARVVCHAPFVATNSATVQFLQSYSVDKSGRKTAVSTGAGESALERDILTNAYRFAAPRMKETGILPAP